MRDTHTDLGYCIALQLIMLDLAPLLRDERAEKKEKKPETVTDTT
jgi:hypothetical protein